MFAKWKGPAEIIEIKSPYSYVVEYNGSRYHLHANKLRKFCIQADEAECDNAAYVTPDLFQEAAGVCNCAVIYTNDVDFGNINVVSPDIFQQPVTLPSEKVDKQQLAHLNLEQQAVIRSS